jgi:hypothetical protein
VSEKSVLGGKLIKEKKGYGTDDLDVFISECEFGRLCGIYIESLDKRNKRSYLFFSTFPIYSRTRNSIRGIYVSYTHRESLEYWEKSLEGAVLDCLEGRFGRGPVKLPSVFERGTWKISFDNNPITD